MRNAKTISPPITASLTKAACLTAMLLIAITCPQKANAGLSDCTVQSAQLLGPEHEQVIAVTPMAIDIGDFVGSFRFFRVIYRCKSNGSSFKWTFVERKSASTFHSGFGVIYDGDGQIYSVFTTPQLQTLGLGFMGTIYLAIDGLWPSSNKMLEGADSAPIIWVDPLPTDAQGYSYHPVTFRTRFVKISNNLDNILNTVSTTPYPLAFPLAKTRIIDDEGYVSPEQELLVHMPTLHIAQRACTPFVQTVSLPSVDASVLPIAGATGSSTHFRFTVRCPHNAAWFGYYVESLHGYENEAQGVIKIDPNSSAKGIGLQITTRNYAHPLYPSTSTVFKSNYEPIKFGPTNRYGAAGYTMVNVTGDPLNDESDYFFPRVSDDGQGGALNVAVYRTGGPLVPGSYTAALKVYMVYR